jgi:hypothetical protein
LVSNHAALADAFADEKPTNHLKRHAIINEKVMSEKYSLKRYCFLFYTPRQR